MNFNVDSNDFKPGRNFQFRMFISIIIMSYLLGQIETDEESRIQAQSIEAYFEEQYSYLYQDLDQTKDSNTKRLRVFEEEILSMLALANKHEEDRGNQRRKHRQQRIQLQNLHMKEETQLEARHKKERDELEQKILKIVQKEHERIEREEACEMKEGDQKALMREREEKLEKKEKQIKQMERDTEMKLGEIQTFMREWEEKWEIRNKEVNEELERRDNQINERQRDLQRKIREAQLNEEPRPNRQCKHGMTSTKRIKEKICGRREQ